MQKQARYQDERNHENDRKVAHFFEVYKNIFHAFVVYTLIKYFYVLGLTYYVFIYRMVEIPGKNATIYFLFY